MDVNGCRRMIQAAKKNKRLLEIGYQDFYEPLYWAAYRNIVKQGVLGDVYTVKAVWNSYSSGRVDHLPDAVSFDPRPWGFASLEELSNWRLYRRYSNGISSEWGGALVSLTNWFLNSAPDAVQATGGIYYKDGRDVEDHVYATLEYPHGRTATLSLLQSNGFEGRYAQFMGTKGTLILGKGEALLFTEEGSKPATIGVAKVNGSQPVMDTSASRSEEASSHSVLAAGANSAPANSSEAYQRELAGFCGAIRTSAPLRCDLAHAFDVARICFAVNDAIARSKRLNLDGSLALCQPGNGADNRSRYA